MCSLVINMINNCHELNTFPQDKFFYHNQFFVQDQHYEKEVWFFSNFY